MFRALLRNETLEKLDMEGNGLSDGVGPLIATVLQTNSTLRELHLHSELQWHVKSMYVMLELMTATDNRLGLGTAEAIAKALPNTQSLEVLDLRGKAGYLQARAMGLEQPCCAFPRQYAAR